MTKTLINVLKSAVQFILLAVTFIQAAEINESNIPLQVLCDSRTSYRNLLTLDSMNRMRPNPDAYVFARILELQAEHPFKTSAPELQERKKEKFNAEGGKYIYFTKEEIVRPKSYFASGEHYRLDIEGSCTENKDYVRLQLQNHEGQGHSYASILLPKATPIHVNLLYFALNLSCYMLFEKDVEAMKAYENKVDQPFNIKLDDPIFTKRNPHIKKNIENIQKALSEGVDLRTYKDKKAAEAIMVRQKKEAAKNRKLPPYKKWVESAQQ